MKIRIIYLPLLPARFELLTPALLSESSNCCHFWKKPLNIQPLCHITHRVLPPTMVGGTAAAPLPTRRTGL